MFRSFTSLPPWVKDKADMQVQQGVIQDHKDHLVEVEQVTANDHSVAGVGLGQKLVVAATKVKEGEAGGVDLELHHSLSLTQLVRLMAGGHLGGRVLDGFLLILGVVSDGPGLIAHLKQVSLV